MYPQLCKQKKLTSRTCLTRHVCTSAEFMTTDSTLAVVRLRCCACSRLAVTCRLLRGHVCRLAASLRPPKRDAGSPMGILLLFTSYLLAHRLARLSRPALPHARRPRSSRAWRPQSFLAWHFRLRPTCYAWAASVLQSLEPSFALDSEL